MQHLDNNLNVIEWSSEEIIIPYLSPIDGKYHRYFPDFFVRTTAGAMILEVKPKNQSIMPEAGKKKTKKYLTEIMTWGVNQAKWKAAEEYCADRSWKFKVITEDELFGKKK